MTTSEGDLAVVVVNYNSGEYLQRCLASLQRHRGGVNLDVLVIDNASHDDSHTSAIAAHPWARLIANENNRGLSAAWNQGIRETQAPYLLFLNPDTEIWCGSLADYLHFAREHPRAGIVGPLVRNADGTIYPSGRSFPSVVDALGHAFLGGVAPGNPFTGRYLERDWDRSSERRVDWVSGCCMLLPRTVFEEAGVFDEEFFLYGEELDMATRLASVGLEVVFTPMIEIVHEIGVSTGTSRRIVLLHSASIYRYYRKHRAAGPLRLTLPFAWLALRLRAELEWLRRRLRP